MNAILLTEAGRDVGLGHLGRCVALGDELAAAGCVVRYVIAGEASIHVVGEREVVIDDWRSPDGALTFAEGADIAVIDSYHADLDVYQAVAESAVVAVYLDDTARLPYPRGIVVNGNPEASGLAFETGSDTQLLLGIEFQLLRFEFVSPSSRPIREHVEQILVVSGGANVGGERDQMRAVASRAYPEASIDVVAAPRTAAQMRDAMLSADLAVSAAGQTLYELASTGTPAVAFCTADNQIAQARAFERAATLVLAGEWGEGETLDRALELLGKLESAESRKTMSSSGRALIDGRGAGRVAAACIEALRARSAGGSE